MLKLNNKRTYSEMYEILNILGTEYIDKLPEKLYQLIAEQRDINYNPVIINQDGNINQEAITRETISLFAVLNMKYWIEDQNVKEEFFKQLQKNENKYLEMQKRKYSEIDIFTNNKKENSEISSKENIQIEENLAIVKVRQNIFFKILNKIKVFLKF